jgi:hypothetical protein
MRAGGFVRQVRRTWIGLAAALWLFAAVPAPAQCPMCRSAAAAQPPKAAKALNLAIVIMFVPALALFSSVILLSFRYRSTPIAEDVGDRERPAYDQRVPAGRNTDEEHGVQ